MMPLSSKSAHDMPSLPYTRLGESLAEGRKKDLLRSLPIYPLYSGFPSAARRIDLCSPSDAGSGVLLGRFSACPRSLLTSHLPGLETCLPEEASSRLMAFEPGWAALYRLVDIDVLHLPGCLASIAVPLFTRLPDNVQVGTVAYLRRTCPAISDLNLIPYSTPLPLIRLWFL